MFSDIKRDTSSDLHSAKKLAMAQDSESNALSRYHDFFFFFARQDVQLLLLLIFFLGYAPQVYHTFLQGVLGGTVSMSPGVIQSVS